MRHQIAAHTGFSVKFQSTHSLRSATPRSPLHPRIPGFQSTHSLRSATARTRAQVMSMRGVSIHALLAECDRLADQPVDRPGRFNPRTPCGVRLGTTIGLAHACEFQSTHSLRSATSHLPPLPCIEPFQSTHSLRSATLNVSEKARPLVVSIHALLAECDWIPWYPGVPGVVSIHALLAECDNPRQIRGLPAYRFNPRTPCGVRPDALVMAWHARRFQSTHSLRSATAYRPASS